MISRIPVVGSGWLFGSLGGNRLVAVKWPFKARSAPAAYRSSQNAAYLSLLPWPFAEENCGWCQNAKVQVAELAARSAFSHFSCADPALQPVVNRQLAFSAIRCHDPMSKL